MSYKKLIGLLLLTLSLLFPGSQAMAAVWTDHYDASNGYSFAGEGISTITFDDWGYTGPGGRNAKNFESINGFGTLGQRQHVATLWPDRLTPDAPGAILKDLQNTPVYTNANMDAQVNFYHWGYTSPGFDVPGDYTAYRAGDYSASTHRGSLFNNMLIDLDGDYLVNKADMHFGYYDTFSYVDATGANPPQEVVTSLSFQPYPVSEAIGWCGSVLASHPAALEVMAGQLTFDFAFDVYSGTNRVFMGTQVAPRFEMRSYGTLTINVWAGSELQTFSSNAVINNTNPANTDRWDVAPNYYSRVSFHGGGVLPDGAWVSADSFNPDGSRKMNPDGTWNVTVVPAGTAGAVWHANAFAGYAFILRADGIRLLDWFNEPVYGPDPCTTVNCDDGNACTTDSCVGGVCVHANRVCNDNNFCTTDTCDAATGACVFTPVPGCGLCAGQPDGTSCTDGNPCTVNDACSGQVCAGATKNCDDGNICTADSCDTASGNCTHISNYMSCDDGNSCTTGDICSGGVCTGKAGNCDDGNICTTDSCDAATGNCVHAFNTVSCDDGNACTTQDVCSGGICSGTAVPGCGAGGVDTANNNFTMLDPTGGLSGGTNDVHFTWDGTMKTSVDVSGQVSNATLDSPCPFFGITWMAHDVAIYGPGTYTVYADCPAGSPGCGAGAPITFTVGAGELGAHMLFNWGSSSDIDVVDIWAPKAVFGPSPLQTAGCGSNPVDKVWDWMSKDWDGDGLNGYGMVDGPFMGFNASFNVMGVLPPAVDTVNNNFTMIDGIGGLSGGTNDVHFTWDGTKKTSVDVSGQVSNATLDSPCPFFGLTWMAHDVAIYGPGTYTVYADCPAGSPGCGAGAPITFTVGAGELGAHMLFNWGSSSDIDVVDIWAPQAVFGPSPLQTAGCGSNPVDKVWDWMSKDWDGDGLNGYGMVDGPFIGFNASFNVMGVPPAPVCPASCDDGNACTADSCDAATGACVHTPIASCCTADADCNDNNICTMDACAGNACVYTATVPASCSDNNICTNDGCVNNACTHTATVPASCNDNNICTNDGCANNACTHAATVPALCNDNNACTTDTCVSNACVNTTKNCDDRNACTADTCNPATGCVNTPICSIDTVNNNFTMIDPTGKTIGGSNDVRFNWDGSKKTSVAASGQISNAVISSPCAFQGITWSAHDVSVYGPGSYTVYAGCAAGSPGCGTGVAINFTVGAGQLGAHMLFDWGASKNIDVVDVWNANAAFAPSALWATACGSNPADKVWDLMSIDWNGDGFNGRGMVDGPFLNFNANFNMMGVPPLSCDDNNACTTDSEVGGSCVHTPIVCDDNNLCTTDTCDPAIGCINTAISCDDSNACTTDSCDPATGCVHTAISCNDNNACTTDSCDPASGCVFTAVSCPTGQTCDPATGNCVAVVDLCANTVCNDNNPCTTDTCDPATGGCVFTPISCDDRNACTTDSCDPATGCVNANICTLVQSNNFSMLDPGGNLAGGTNDVAFAWDGTMKTSVAVSGQVANGTISSTCPFFGVPWSAHDLVIYGPGSYTVYTGCPAGSPGCGTGAPINFTVGEGQLGGHMLFDWGGNNDIDVVNVWTPSATFGPSAMWTGDCGSNAATTTWTWMSSDFDGDGFNGYGMVDGPFPGFNANFNLIAKDPCADAATRCNDNNPCTTDSCDPATGACVNTAKDCNDNDSCTTDSCNTTTGACVNTLISCNDNDACTTDSCVAGACINAPIVCDDDNACTVNSCDPLTGCVYFPLPCNDDNACTADSCNPATGCVYTPVSCNDNNACTSDSCNPATGCVYNPISCNDGNLCTADSCNPATGCVFTALPVAGDDNPCTDDSCDPATGLPVYINNAASCDDGVFCNGTDTCSGGKCTVHSGDPCTGGSTCNEASDTCSCRMTALIRGGGQSPNNVDLQIQTLFKVTNGCILDSSTSSITVSAGSTVEVDCHHGTGPAFTSGTWNGNPMSNDTPTSIACPVAGETVKLIITNKDAQGGKDTDRMSIFVQ